MKHIGDITKINGASIEAVDVITGGSPCQDLSVAGKRAGLAGERSGLFMEMVRIIKEMRDATKQLHMQRSDVDVRPRFVVWENVYGAFSSNNGEDFRAVLEEFSKLAAETDVSIPRPKDGKWAKSGCVVGDHWSLAWRGMDACMWGVPQRRKRIALVVDLAGQCASEICFERTSVPGDSESCREEREETSRETGTCIGATSYTLKIRGGVEVDSKGHKAGKGALVQTELSGTLGVSQDQTLITINEPFGFDAYNQQETGETSMTLTAKRSDFHHVPCVYGISPYDSNAMRSNNPNSGIYVADTSRTLDLNGGNPACNQGGMIVLEGNGSRPSHRGDGFTESETMYTLNTTEQHAVCVDQGGGKSSAAVSEEVSTTLSTTHDGAPAVYSTYCIETYHCQSEEEKTQTLMARDYKDPQCVVNTYVLENHPNDSRIKIKEDGIFQTLSGRMGTGGGNTPMVLEHAGEGPSFAQNWDGTQISPTLTANNANGSQRMPDKENFNAVIVNRDRPDPIVGTDRTYQDKTGSIMASGYQKLGTQEAQNGMHVTAGVVRRLTPLECERLQGFPDGWTDIPGASDSARYKALGNSIALPQWRFVLGNISKYLPKDATLGSLFDGIGGFPLIWEEIHGTGTARWASEIEKFPIDVTTIRFPENRKENENV